MTDLFCLFVCVYMYRFLCVSTDVLYFKGSVIFSGSLYRNTVLGLKLPSHIYTIHSGVNMFLKVNIIYRTDINMCFILDAGCTTVTLLCQVNKM